MRAYRSILITETNALALAFSERSSISCNVSKTTFFMHISELVKQCCSFEYCIVLFSAHTHTPNLYANDRDLVVNHSVIE